MSSVGKMSEISSDLMSRVRVVAPPRAPSRKWVILGEGVLRDARVAKGLSTESLARLLHVSGKTIERWEKRGEAPRHFIYEIASVLDLDVEPPPRFQVLVPTEPDLAQILEAVQLLVARFDGIERQLRELLER